MKKKQKMISGLDVSFNAHLSSPTSSFSPSSYPELLKYRWKKIIQDVPMEVSHTRDIHPQALVFFSCLYSTHIRTHAHLYLYIYIQTIIGYIYPHHCAASSGSYFASLHSCSISIINIFSKTTIKIFQFSCSTILSLEKSSNKSLPPSPSSLEAIYPQSGKKRIIKQRKTKFETNRSSGLKIYKKKHTHTSPRQTYSGCC